MNGDELLKGFDVDPAHLNQYQPKPATSGNKARLLLKLIGAAFPSVNVDTSGAEPNMKVEAPFMNVNVTGGLAGVKVYAPFVNVNTENGISVKASFVSLNKPLASTAPLLPSSQASENPKATTKQNAQTAPSDVEKP